ncbi:MAG: hypothetical protein QM702_04315 [Rubrivivax sp.]
MGTWNYWSDAHRPIHESDRRADVREADRRLQERAAELLARDRVPVDDDSQDLIDGGA